MPGDVGREVQTDEGGRMRYAYDEYDGSQVFVKLFFIFICIS
jgi:hypothetical protein